MLILKSYSAFASPSQKKLPSVPVFGIFFLHVVSWKSHKWIYFFVFVFNLSYIKLIRIDIVNMIQMINAFEWNI